MDKWILSDTYMQFEGINLHITVDEERGNYEMSVILPFLDNLDYLPQLGRGLWDVGFEFNESNNLYHFKDKENKYVVDKKAKYANLTFIREDREGFLLEEEVEELFNSYRRVKDVVRTDCGDFDGLDNYLINFGYDDLMKSKKDHLSSEGGFESKSQLQGRYPKIIEDSIFKEINQIMKTPLTWEETVDFMLEGITELKKNIKEGNKQRINDSKGRIEYYAKKLDYEPTEMLDKILNKKRQN